MPFKLINDLIRSRFQGIEEKVTKWRLFGTMTMNNAAAKQNKLDPLKNGEQYYKGQKI